MNFDVWGLTGTLATEHDHQMEFAQERLWYWINAFDEACNRFKGDSELTRVNARAGSTTSISATLERAIAGALLASDATGGLCDPTVLPAVLALGYDVDYDELVRRHDTPLRAPVKPLGTTAIDLNQRDHTLTLAKGCQLDLGASAKALVADLVADDVAPSGGVVVELGGDVAVRGRGPEGLWAIGVSDSLTVTGAEARVSIGHGGIATSSRTARTWNAGGLLVHHIIDPRTGSFAQGPYATASVSADSALLANAFATAALLWDEDAGYHVGQAGWSARLVRDDGSVDFVGGWPIEVLAS